MSTRVIDAVVSRLKVADLKATVAAEGRSIHPRNWMPGRGEKVNTYQNPRASTRARKVKNLTAHLERHPNDGASRMHLEKLTRG